LINKFVNDPLLFAAWRVPDGDNTPCAPPQLSGGSRVIASNMRLHQFIDLQLLPMEGQQFKGADFTEYPGRSKRGHNRTSQKLEKLILSLRKHLRGQSDLDESGAVAVYRELIRCGINNPPALGTIGYILQCYGATDDRHRRRRMPPAKGWYLPDVAN
jgi:hypothetical protein